jgi:hypothetical protein
MSGIEMIEQRLRGFLASPDDADWHDVMRRAEMTLPGARRRRRGLVKQRGWRPVLVTAVAVAALAGAGVAIAAGLGAFNGLSRAQQPQIGTDVPGPDLAAAIGAFNAFLQDAPGSPQVLPDTVRLLGELPSPYGKVYVASDTRGNLCIFAAYLGDSCGEPLSQSNPVSIGEANDTGSNPVAYGVAMDGITAVSFQAAGQQITVPVKNNLWYYEGPNSAMTGDMTLHLANGSTELLQHGSPAN